MTRGTSDSSIDDLLILDRLIRPGDPGHPLVRQRPASIATNHNEALGVSMYISIHVT